MSPAPPRTPGRRPTGARAPAENAAEDTAADQRIAKLLARAGVASRREVERMIAEGRVALNGGVIVTPATVIASLAGVTVDGEPVEAPAPARLFLYHKPAGLLVTERDPGGRPTIYDRLPDGLPRVVPVGRLDLGTEGLLLLTTDGGLKRQLELPATGVQRAYRARAYGDVTQGALEALIEGVTVEGVRYGSIDANLERRTGANVWIEMVLTEGKNREVRRVLEYLGLQVSRLIRTRYGPFALGDLAPGEVAEIRGHDIASFRKNPTRLDLPQPARQRGVPRDEALAPASMPVASPRPGRPGRPLRNEPRRGSPGRDAAPRAAGQDAAPRGQGQDVAPRAQKSSPPIRAARPAAAATIPRERRDERPGRPPRGSSPPGRVGAAQSPASVDQPARAARARKFRETREPADTGSARRDGAAPSRTADARRPAGRTGGPALGRGSPPRSPAPGKPPRGGGGSRPTRSKP